MSNEFPSPTWLQDKLANSAESKVYQSLDQVYLDQTRNLIRIDNTFEALVKKCPNINSSKLLAVDYAFYMLGSEHVQYPEGRLQELVGWLVQSAPNNHKPVVLAYLEGHDKTKDVAGAMELLQERSYSEFRKNLPETGRLVEDLLSPEPIRMHVFRISDSAAGEDINKFLGAVRKKLGLGSQFELLADFKDLNIKKEMEREWWQTFQQGPCNHLVGSLRKKCDCTKFKPQDKVSSEQRRDTHAF